MKSELFGGRGEVEVRDLLGRKVAEPFEAVLGCELAPRGSVGTHQQQSAHEIVVALGGRAKVTVDGQPAELEAGGLAYVPLGATLAIENLLDDPFHYLIVKAHAAPR